MAKTYGPYSSNQVVGDLVFTSGQIGAVNGIAGESIEDQTKQALINLGNVLSDAGASFSTVVKTTIYLTDMSHYKVMNEIYATFFEQSGARPVRTCVSIKELPRVADKPLLIEVDAVAYLETA